MTARLGLVTTWAVPSPTVEITGDVDATTSEQLRDILWDLIDAGHRRIVLDLAAATFLDAAGIAVIVAAIERIGPDIGHIAIISPPPRIMRVVTMARLSHLVEQRGAGALAIGPTAPESARTLLEVGATA